MEKIKVRFLGAAGTVTGSKFLIETSQQNIMVDCGMFQGLKELRERNWEDLPLDASTIDVILLTHGHLDHCGYLPRMVKQGFHGKIIGTEPTLEIAKIILLDSGKIHEEEAEKANKEGYSKHNPALPFYTVDEALNTINYFKYSDKDIWNELTENIKFRFCYNGHILGATFIELDLFGKIFVFSGDIGRFDDPLLFPPQKPKWADYLFLESTYGNKIHPPDEFEKKAITLVNQTLLNRGTLIIPSFAVERLQVLMYLFWTLYKKNKIPKIPIYIDSPMGNRVFGLFKKFAEWHKLSPSEYQSLINNLNIITSYKETWETIDNPRPKIVIAGSGMVTGGRVLTYLQQLIDEPSTSILLVGYQAEGTRGRKLLDGFKEIKIYGKYYSVNAQVHLVESMSAHADQSELLNWVSNIKNIPEKVFLIHGDSEPLAVLKAKLEMVHRWNVSIPQINDIREITIC